MPPQVIVIEPEARWVSAFRRFAQAGEVVREARWPEAAEAWLEERPDSAVALTCSPPTAAATALWLSRRMLHRPGLLPILLVPRDPGRRGELTAEARRLLQFAGAGLVMRDFLQTPAVWRAVRRHAAMRRQSAP